MEASAEKTCTRCHTTQPVEHFPKVKAAEDWRRGFCRSCRRTESKESARRSYAANPDARRKSSRDWYHANKLEARDKQLQWRYGITLTQYNALLERQGGVCGLCEEQCRTGRNLAVDHDHSCCPGNRSCGKCVRGLLCDNCNRRVVADRPAEFFDRGAAYLRGDLWGDES